MAYQSFNPRRNGVTLATFGQDVARRRAAAGVIDMPRNAGNRRTESKQMLLAALADTGADW